MERVRYWKQGQGMDRTLDQWLGIADRTVSAGARELCSRIVLPGGSFAKAAANLLRIGQIRISDERLRQIVQAEGRQVTASVAAGQVRPDWRAEDCRVKPEGPTRVIVGTDGVMVPVITEVEKRTRRDNLRRRRKARPRPGKARRRAGARRRVRGEDQGFKEFKIAAFYDQSRTHRYAVGTAGDHRTLGRLLRREACKLNLGKADEKISVTDGAEWIRRQLQIRLPILDAMILDFYHLAERIGTAARLCFGEGADKAHSWASRLRSTAKDQGPAALLAEVHQTLSAVRSPTKRAALTDLRQYIIKRTEMMDYPTFRSRGLDIGSGPTEALCKTLTSRLKGSGRRWNKSNAQAMMALAALEHSDLWKTYWDRQVQAAA